MSAELVKAAPSLLEVVQQIVGGGALDMSKMEVVERMLAMQERIIADQRKEAFFNDLAACQAEMPQIHKAAQGKHNKYASYEAIDKIIRPIIRKYGFAERCSQSGIPDDKGRALFVYTVSKGAHSESSERWFTVDAAAKNSSGVAIRSALQDDGATTSFAKRYLRNLFFNVVTTGEDVDGEPNKPISHDQELNILAMISDYSDAQKSRFLAVFAIQTVADLLAVDHDKAMRMLNTRGK